MLLRYIYQAMHSPVVDFMTHCCTNFDTVLASFCSHYSSIQKCFLMDGTDSKQDVLQTADTTITADISKRCRA